MGKVGEPCLQASLIQFSIDQKPERSPTQMAIAAHEWKLLAVAHPIKKQLLSTFHNNTILNLEAMTICLFCQEVYPTMVKGETY